MFPLFTFIKFHQISFQICPPQYFFNIGQFLISESLHRPFLKEEEIDENISEFIRSPCFLIIDLEEQMLNTNVKSSNYAS